MQLFRLIACTAVVAAIAAATVPAIASSTAGSGSNEWQVDLSAADSKVNVTSAGGRLRVVDQRMRLGTQPGPAGYLVTKPHHLDDQVNQVGVEVTGTAAVEVRGRAGTNPWNQWTEVPGRDLVTLPTPVTEVQFRINLTGTATVSKVSARGSMGQSIASAPTAQIRSYQVFGTREGLVGGRTANGHVIKPRDHFVALPSRRGLNSYPGKREYMVDICYPKTGRCVTEPVEDVGPWNTTDDYWNPAPPRQSWTNLPQGVPQAQAARGWGYNGGRDQFGRYVGNPAGIDLADGTFWDSLGMRDNDWVWVGIRWPWY